MKFQCQESCGGKCCKKDFISAGGFVFLTKADRDRLTRRLNKPLTDFASLGEFEHTSFSGKEAKAWFLNDNDQGCIFFKDGKCEVYEDRPIQCKTYPFWPENMDPDAWKQVAEMCPGVGVGEVPARAGEMLQAQFVANEELLTCDPLL